MICKYFSVLEITALSYSTSLYLRGRDLPPAVLYNALHRAWPNGAGNAVDEAQKLKRCYFLCSGALLYFRFRVDRLRWRQRAYSGKFDGHHHLASRGGSEPALFAFSQW